MSIDRAIIGKAAKKKNYQKWNAQVKLLTDISSLDSGSILATQEVIKTSDCYWFFQDYTEECSLPLTKFLGSGAQLDILRL